MISATVQPEHAAWPRLHHPATVADVRARRLLWDGVRAAKEMLSRASSTFVYVPLLETEVPLGREQFESLARPTAERTIRATRTVLRDAGVSERDLDRVFLVGGASRIPLVATTLHRAFGPAPLMVDQPESVVAHGSVVPLASTMRAAPTQIVRPRPEAPAPEAGEAAEADPTLQRVAPNPTVGGPRPRNRTRTWGVIAAVSIVVIVSLWIATSNAADLSRLDRSTVARALNSAPSTGPAGDLIAEHAAVPDCKLISRDPAFYETFHGFLLHSVAFVWRSPDSRFLNDDPELQTSIGSQVNQGIANGLGGRPAAAGARRHL